MARFSPASDERSGGRTAARISIAVAVVALAAVAAVASRSPLGGSAGSSEVVVGNNPVAKIPAAWVIALIIAATAVALFEVVYALRTRAHGMTPRRRRGFSVLGLVQFVAIAVVLALALHGLGHRSHSSRAAVATRRARAGGHQYVVRHSATSPIPVWLAVGGLSALVVVDAVILAIAFAPRRGRGPATGLPDAEAARGAVEGSLIALEEERDPRRAVIAAYRRMEVALSEAGLPRAASESPREYLDRTLGSLEVSSAPVSTLTSLFERARFSRRRIEPRHRDLAVEALRQLRDELEVDLHAVGN